MLQSALYSNPHGLGVRSQTFRVINRSGGVTVVGEVYQLDMGHETVGNETVGYTDSGDTSVFGTIVDVTTNGALAYPLVVCLEAVADDTDLTVQICGIVPVLVKGANLCALTDTLHAIAGDVELNSDVATTADETLRVVGIPLEVTAGATAELIDVLFDGMGMGVKWT